MQTKLSTVNTPVGDEIQHREINVKGDGVYQVDQLHWRPT
jgi:hypothetical protein